MQKKIFHTEVTDNTGTTLIRKIVRVSNLDTESFVRAYIQDIGALARCSASEISTVLCSLKYLDYDTNEIVFTSSRRKEVQECANLKPSTFNNALTSLKKKNILIQEDSKYILNPKLFFYGSELSRMKMFELKICYEIK